MITTIIPTYRRPQRLRKAIISVLDQTYPDFQVCVYDNASGDETPDVVAQFARDDPRVKYYCHSENIGGIANFNYGMKHVTSPLFSVLSDDNTLLPTFFEDAIRSLKQHPEAILYAGHAIGIDEKGKRHHQISRELWDAGLVFPPNGLLHIIEKGLPSAIDGVLFRKEVLDLIGILDPSFNGAADQDYMMRIARHHVLYVSEKPCVLFLLHENSWSDQRDLEEIVTTRKRLLERWYTDESLASMDIQRRIDQAYKRYVKNAIPNAVLMKCIIGNDREAISKVRYIMIRERVVSFKSIWALLLAEAAHSSHFLRKIILRVIRLLRR
jgi:glycosyltransferase involved in cell wall biosynthesis